MGRKFPGENSAGFKTIPPTFPAITFKLGEILRYITRSDVSPVNSINKADGKTDILNSFFFEKEILLSNSKFKRNNISGSLLPENYEH
jgi:hypothetical protein